MPIVLTAFLADAPAPAAPTSAPVPPGPDMMTMLVYFFAVIIIMWVLMIRPQQKRQKELAEKVSALKNGDRVVTIGGVHATVVSVKDNETTLIISIAENTRVKIDKTAIATILKKDSKES